MQTEAADLSTDEIIAAIRRGEIDAYAQIVARYQGEVLKIVNAMLIDYSAREDLVQQVFVRAFQRLEQYEIGRSFGKWIKAITRNLVKEELRKRYRYAGRIETYARNMVALLESGEVGDEAAREREGILRDCIAQLEETAARVIRLHYLEQRKTDDIAETLGRTGGAIRTLLYRARSHLRTCMEAKGVWAS